MDSKPLDELAAPGEDVMFSPRQLRALKIAVAVMGIVLVVGFLGLVARIFYLATRHNDQAAHGFKAEIELALPQNAQVRNVSLAGDRLAVHYDGPEGPGIAVIDLASGNVLSRISVRQGTQRRP
ncbi:MAG: DUF6476 family protein [Hyphomicrobiaceae bacterium]|jgi:hypothetical protein